MNIASVCQHSIITDYLTPDSVVLDCGVNRAEFSSWLAENKHCTVHGFEPDPGLFQKLPKLDKVHFHQLAVSDKSGSKILNLGTSMCSSLVIKEAADSRSATVKTTSLEDFCSAHSIRRVDLLKLDIEGEEIPVLLNLPPSTLGMVHQITVEFHDMIDRAYVPKIHEVIARLRGAGFYYTNFTHDYFTDVLFVNQALTNLSLADKLKITGAKYHRGVARRIRRCFLRSS